MVRCLHQRLYVQHCNQYIDIYGENKSFRVQEYIVRHNNSVDCCLHVRTFTL